MEYSKKNTYNIYNIWTSMMKRCYNNKYPTYNECYVIEEWKDLQIFGKWCDENYIDGFELDKDILIKNNKCYSSETCCFVPQDINKLFTKSKAKRGNLPIGVRLSGNNYQARISENNNIKTLGTYTSIELAFNIYKTEKENIIKEKANFWKHKISEKTYIALYNYKVEITD